jgi:hypothetical protein
MPGYHPRTPLTAEDAKDAKENQKRGKNGRVKSRLGAEMTTDTKYLFSDVFLLLPFLRVLVCSFCTCMLFVFSGLAGLGDGEAVDRLRPG